MRQKQIFGSQTPPSKKTIKKRGRIKWTEKHQKILIGGVLLFQDNIIALNKMLPQFNSSIIQKKLKQLNWRKYLCSGKAHAPHEEVLVSEPRTEGPSSLLKDSHVRSSFYFAEDDHFSSMETTDPNLDQNQAFSFLNLDHEDLYPHKDITLFSPIRREKQSILFLQDSPYEETPRSQLLFDELLPGSISDF